MSPAALFSDRLRKHPLVCSAYDKPPTILDPKHNAAALCPDGMANVLVARKAARFVCEHNSSCLLAAKRAIETQAGHSKRLRLSVDPFDACPGRKRPASGVQGGKVSHARCVRLKCLILANTSGFVHNTRCSFQHETAEHHRHQQSSLKGTARGAATAPNKNLGEGGDRSLKLAPPTTSEAAGRVS